MSHQAGQFSPSDVSPGRIVAAAPIGIWQLDLDNRTTFVNSKMSEMLGYSSDEMLNRSLFEFIDQESQAAVAYGIEHCHQARQEQHDCKFCCRDGSVLWAIVSLAPLLDETNRCVGILAAVTDISNRKNREIDLCQREQEFRTLADNAPAIISRFDQQLRHTYVNPAIKKATGFTPEAFVGKTNRELGMPEDLLRDWEFRMQQVFNLGQEDVSEFEFEGPDGCRHYQVRFVPEFDSDRAVKSILGITVDITQLKQTEEALQRLNEELELRVQQRTQKLVQYQIALQEQTQILRAILNSIGDGVVVADKDGRMLVYNSAAARIVGLSSSDASSIWSAHNSAFLPNHTASYLLKQLPLSRAICGEAADNVEVHIPLSDRPEGVFLDVTIRPFKNAQGQILGGVNTFRDITEKKLLERTLQESERRLQAIIDSSPVTIFAKDLEGRYILVNQLCAAQKGLPQKQMIGKTDNEVISDDIAALWSAQDQEVIDAKSPKEYEEVIAYNGRRRTYITHKFPLFDAADIPYAICGISTDITERKRLEEQIWASLRQKDLVIQEIHHRIKNNLQIVSSLLTLQSRSMKDLGTIRLFKDCQNRILSIALIHEQLYRSHDLTNINFAEYIHNLVNHIAASYYTQPEQVRLTFELANVSLNLDTVLPCGLLINELVSNSLKYAFPKQQQGNLFIKLSSANNGQLTLIVSDDGVGLPDNFDIQQSRSLGLQLVRDLASQLKGTLTLERSQGTRFQLTFFELKSQLRL